MKKKIILIIILMLILVGGLVTYFNLPKKENNVLLPENLTVVESPEQTEPMEHDYFKVEEWVPVIPEGTNVALNAKASANNMGTGYVPNKSIDGDLTTYYEGAPDSFPNELTLDLKDTYTIHAVKVCLNPQSVWSKRTQTIEILAGDSADSLTTIVPLQDYGFDPKTGNEIVIEFDDIEAEFVMLRITNNTGAVGGQAGEFEVYAR